MRMILAAAAACLLAACTLAGCTPAQETAALSRPAGQLFCAVQTSGGGAVVVGLINAGVAGSAPGAAPLAVIATGASKAYVDNACAQARGVAVSPPANPAAVPQVAVVPPVAGAPAAPAAAKP